MDISKLTEVKRIFSKVIDEFGRFEILVNTAAVFIPQNFFNVTEKLFDKSYSVNLKGTLFTCKEASDYWIKNKIKGKIVNFSSIAGRITMPHNLPYAVIKAAVIHMSQIIALELGKYEINVNVICPGLVDTPMAKPFLSNPEFVKSDLARIPMGKIQTIEQCVNATLFLASKLSDQITGEVISVDGGWHLGHP